LHLIEGGLAVTSTPTDAKKAKLFRYTNAKLREEGYETVYEFVRRSRVPFTMETVRKAFNECDYKSMGAATLAVILKYLNVPPPEIRRVLKEMTGDEEIWTLLPESADAASLTPAEQAWQNIGKAIPPEALQRLLGTLELAASRDISTDIATLQRKG
jgi:hypothetical protein